MKTLLRLLMTVTVMGLALPAMAQAPPSYLILRSPQPTGHHPTAGPHHAHVAPRGVTSPVHRPTYAYGWFGVAPRRHWSRHTGYYRNYSQWSAR